jgi:hypothetical protein
VLTPFGSNRLGAPAFGGQIHLTPDASGALTRTEHAALAQFHLHLWATIHPSVGRKDLRDLFGNLAIFSRVSAGSTPMPVRGAADTDPEHPTHRAHRKLTCVLGKKRIAQLWVREKMASAFLKLSRSCRNISFSRLSRCSSSSGGVCCPLPGKASSPGARLCCFQPRRVLSEIPNSRATWASDFPLRSAEFKASRLNSAGKTLFPVSLLILFPVS